MIMRMKIIKFYYIYMYCIFTQ